MEASADGKTEFSRAEFRRKVPNCFGIKSLIKIRHSEVGIGCAVHLFLRSAF